jgi:hypothetical protein
MGPSGLILIGAILCAFGALWTSYQQSRFERDLRLKSDEIVELQRNMIQSVIGGDSFCYITVVSINNQADVGILTVIHQGDHPIYDINARIVDLEQIEKNGDNVNLQIMQQAESSISIGNMIPNTASAFGSFPLGSTKSKSLNIFFSARNGLFTQLLRFRKIEGKWQTALKVIRNEKTIFEEITDDYPRSNNGEIEW